MGKSPRAKGISSHGDVEVRQGANVNVTRITTDQNIVLQGGARVSASLSSGSQASSELGKKTTIENATISGLDGRYDIETDAPGVETKGKGMRRSNWRTEVKDIIDAKGITLRGDGVTLELRSTQDDITVRNGIIESGNPDVTVNGQSHGTVTPGTRLKSFTTR